MTRPIAVEAVPSQAAAPPPRRRRTVAAAALVVLLAAASLFVWRADLLGGHDQATFEVRDQRTGEVLHQHEVTVGTTFTLEHTHSVTRRLVRETFSVQEGPHVALEELWFDEPGPNLPSGSEPLGEGTTTFLREDGAFRVLHHSYPIGEVPLMVGSADVDHVLNFPGGEQLRLLDIAASGTPVELRVR